MSQRMPLVVMLVLAFGLPSLAAASEPDGQTTTIPVVVLPEDPRTAEELGATLCVNEGSWREADCAAITHIRLRNAIALFRGRHGRSPARTAEDRELLRAAFRETLIRLHGDLATTRDGAPRLNASLRTDRVEALRDSRPWIGDLRADLHRPRHFPEDGSWEGTYRSEYQKILALVEGVLAGSIGDPCSDRSTGLRGGGRPFTWGGPRVDAEALERMYARGYRRVVCRYNGEPTVNIFLTQVAN